MGNIFIFNFIIYNFLKAHILGVTIFHCWDVKTQNVFSNMSSNNFLYTRFVNLNRSFLTTNVENNFLRNKNPVLGIFIDMNCENSALVLNMSSRERLYGAKYKWIVYDIHSNIDSFKRLFVNANLSIDADLTYAVGNLEQYNYQNVSYILYDVYNNGRHIGGKLNMTIDRKIYCDIAVCRLEAYLSNLHLRSKYDNRNQMFDVTMRVSNVVTKYPLDRSDEEIQQYLDTSSNPYIDVVPRFGHRLTKLYKEMFKCNFLNTYHTGWSVTESKGGIVGELIDETADIGNTPFFVTPKRLQYLSILADSAEFRSVCIFRTPRNADIHGDVFLAPFTTTVWLIFGFVLLVSAIFLWYIFRVEHNRLRKYLQCLPSLSAAFLISFGTACFQGTYIIPRSTGGRMAYLALSFISFIMYNYYTSIVVSSLLGSPVKSKIKTLEQLADSSLEVGLEPVVYTMVYLNTSQLPQVRNFVKRKIEARKSERIWMPIDEGILKVRDKPGFVYVLEAGSGYAILEKYYEPHEICDLNEIKLRSEQSIHFQVHKNSTYKELIRLRTMRLFETGLHRRNRIYWIRSTLNCFASNFVIDVGMEYAAPLFFMLICSYGLVMIVLFLEIFYTKRSLKRKLLMEAKNTKLVLSGDARD